MELSAAILGVKLPNRAQKVLEIEHKEMYFLTDSEDVLYWLTQNHRVYKLFVANRVSKIRDSTYVTQLTLFI